ncbi:mechanosensitive ion channel family protein [Deinococcus humi]|uniref:Small conductance mechanosensitive channel n=1 Tax=Deinococcus humi TaxID=662880 RepID=A0A7W8NF06_9DEIO|nr:mechanosensitive ion channel family protein [Deinococcus humi]MBB5363210.1 small conductance mechanosensitive channel [Deinococcus humi]GGO27667.1 mechanosensitive ion channel protein MscS [Deinococcus humi]
MANEVDTSRLLGVDTISGTVIKAWNDAVQSAAEYGPSLLLALALAALYTLVFWGISRALHSVVRRIVPPEAQPVTHRILRLVLRLTLLMLVLISASALFPLLAKYGPAIFRVYALLLLLYVGWTLLDFVLHRQTRRWGLDASLNLLMTNVVRVVWATSGIYLIFQQFNVNLLPILGGLGVLGLAVGFAAQDILANLISGVTLLLDRPFRIGDWIRVKDQEGQVSGLTLRTTRIRTRDNEFVSIPNKDVAGAVVVNLTAGGPLRLNVQIGVEYRERVEDVRRILLEVMAAHPRVEKSPAPLLLVRELSASSVDVIMRFWVSEANIASYPVISMQMLEAAKEALQASGMNIPFPHLQLHIDGAKGLETLLPAALDRPARPQREEH